jgi:oxygen-independent coproporphyrinogen-3 oxidase
MMSDDGNEPTRFTACAGLLDRSEPEVGNYFVSTYPPFSCWSEGAVDAYQRRLAQPPASGDVPLGLYVHIPFCVERCQYCYYLSYDNQASEIDGYLERLADEWARYARAPAVADRPLDFVYFGGGTPSILSVARLRSLARALQRSGSWADAREITFECAPRSVTADKVQALRDLGVTRLSLGVQQLDDAVLAANGRIHLTADVERAYESIRLGGFDIVNLDLMVGLVGETDESFFASLERVIGFRSESITIYQLEIPLNTPLYRSLRAAAPSQPPASWDVKHARLGAAMARLEAAGYTIRSAYSAVLDPARHPFVYQDAQYHGADLIGIGASAFSHLGGVNQQNLASLAAYLDAGARDQAPVWRAYELSARERLVREFILQLKLGGVKRSYFQEKFETEVLATFAEPLDETRRRGWISIGDEAITVTREGLVRVDRWLPAFYLPEHQNVRYS